MNTEGRLDRALALLEERHRTDPAHPNSLEYHRSLAHFTELLSPLPPTEALVLAANAQHVQRWDRPRHDYPEGLTGYKMWRTALNKYHADILHQVMRSAGYDDSNEQDAQLFDRTRDLLLKRTLQRPPLPKDVSLLKGGTSVPHDEGKGNRAGADSLFSCGLRNSNAPSDSEAHLFEDAICLTFLARDFAKFAAEYQHPPASTTTTSSGATSTPSTESTAPTTEAAAPAAPTAAATPRAGGLDKLGTIVSRTWAKMTVRGRQVAVRDLVGTLDPELQTVVVDAVTACERAEDS